MAIKTTNPRSVGLTVIAETPDCTIELPIPTVLFSTSRVESSLGSSVASADVNIMSNDRRPNVSVAVGIDVAPTLTLIASPDPVNRLLFTSLVGTQERGLPTNVPTIGAVVPITAISSNTLSIVGFTGIVGDIVSLKTQVGKWVSSITAIDGTSVTLSLSTIIPDHTPDASSILEIVGFNCDVGDVSVSVVGSVVTLTGTTTVFSRLQTGDTIVVTGLTDNKTLIAVVRAVDVNAVTLLYSLPSAFVVESGSGKTVKIYQGFHFATENNTTRPSLLQSFTLQHKFSADNFKITRGCSVNELSITVTPRSVVNLGYTTLGLIQDYSTTSIVGTVVDLPVGNAHSTAGHRSLIYQKAQQTIGLPGIMTDLQLKFSNGASTLDQIESMFNSSTLNENIAVDIECGITFVDGDTFTRVLQKERFAVLSVFSQGDTALAVFIPSVYLSTGEDDLSGKAILSKFKLMAEYDDELGFVYQISTFRYSPRIINN